MDLFETSDMSLVTFLRMNDVEPLHTAIRYGKSVRWIFELTADVDEMIDAYETGGALVEPSQFSSTYRRALDEMHAAINTAKAKGVAK